mgnify:CR=1 FL=1
MSHFRPSILTEKSHKSAKEGYISGGREDKYPALVFRAKIVKLEEHEKTAGIDCLQSNSIG